MSKTSINDVPEHLERSLIRPLVENFCYNYMYKNKMETFIIKMVEYVKETQSGKADVYFTLPDGTYAHIVLKLPIQKKQINGKVQLVVDDPVIEVSDKESPRKKKPLKS